MQVLPEPSVILGDCLEILKKQPSNSVDLIVTSPPYADRRSKTYGGVKPEGYVDWFIPRAAEFLRVLKPDGTFILNIKEKAENGERHTFVIELILALRKQGWLWTEEFIWHKKNSWYINATAVTAMPRPRTIHDFFGFPEALFDVQYPAPGLPELADEVSDVVHPTWVGADVDSWGIDHGTWSVLVHAFPDASIPVVQLSINASKSFEHHLELGRKLAPLRERGVLIVASGNVVHNLRGMDWGRTDHGYDWAQRFDQDAKERMLTEPTEFTTLDVHPDYRTAVPTPDHFIPALYLAGLAGTAEGDSRRCWSTAMPTGRCRWPLTLSACHAPPPPPTPEPRCPRQIPPPDESNI